MTALSEETLSKIKNEILEPTIVNDIKDISSYRFKWRKASNYFEAFGKILASMSTIMAFAAGSFSSHSYLAYIAGCMGTVSLACLQTSSYCAKESVERTQQLNSILEKYGIEGLSIIPEANV